MSHDDDTCPHLVVLGRLEAENARLKAEVERLTKAGDWVISHWSSGDGSDEFRFCQALLKWKDAKEGKQS